MKTKSFCCPRCITDTYFATPEELRAHSKTHPTMKPIDDGGLAERRLEAFRQEGEWLRKLTSYEGLTR